MICLTFQQHVVRSIPSCAQDQYTCRTCLADAKVSSVPLPLPALDGDIIAVEIPTHALLTVRELLSQQMRTLPPL